MKGELEKLKAQSKRKYSVVCKVPLTFSSDAVLMHELQVVENNEANLNQKLNLELLTKLEEVGKLQAESSATKKVRNAAVCNKSVHFSQFGPFYQVDLPLGSAI